MTYLIPKYEIAQKIWKCNVSTENVVEVVEYTIVAIYAGHAAEGDDIPYQATRYKLKEIGAAIVEELLFETKDDLCDSYITTFNEIKNG